MKFRVAVVDLLRKRLDDQGRSQDGPPHYVSVTCGDPTSHSQGTWKKHGCHIMPHKSHEPSYQWCSPYGLIMSVDGQQQVLLDRDPMAKVSPAMAAAAGAAPGASEVTDGLTPASESLMSWLSL